MNRKALAVSIVILLFVVSSFVGVSNQTEQAPVDTNTSGTPEETLTKDGLIDLPWPMFGYNAQNIRRSPYSTGDNPGGERWRFYINATPHYSTPVIDAEGTLYCDKYWDELYAVYPNGTLKWMKRFAFGLVFQPTLGQDGTIYIGTHENFYALYPNGTTKWTLPVTGFFCAQPVVGLDGTVFTGTKDTFYAVHPNGTVKWNYTVGYCIIGAAVDDNGDVYVSSYGPELIALSSNGTLRWVFNNLDIHVCAPTISADGTVYLSTATVFHAIRSDGVEKWRTYELPIGFNPAIAPDGTLVMTHIQGSEVYGVDPIDGHIMWKYVAGDFYCSTGASIGSDGTIFFAAAADDSRTLGERAYLYALSPSGDFKWRTQLTCDYAPDIISIYANPSIGRDGTVYVTTWFDRGSNGSEDIGGYIHAIGGGKIQNIEDGYLYYRGQPVVKTFFGRTIVIGPFTLKMAFFRPETLEKAEVLIDDKVICTLQGAPFECSFDRWLVGRHRLEVKGYYNDGTISSDKKFILFFIKG